MILGISVTVIKQNESRSKKGYPLEEQEERSSRRKEDSC